MTRMKQFFILLLLFPALVLGQLAVLLRYLTCTITNPTKAWSIALTVDDSVNVAGNGRLGQTISFRAALAQRAGKRWGCILCELLNVVSPNHCANALTSTQQDMKE